MVKRRECGKLRHIRVGQLWVQEKEASGELGYRKVPGERNPADLGTKYLSERRMGELMLAVGQVWLGGPARVSLEAE